MKVKKLPLYRKDDLVGWLSQKGDRLAFEYAPDWNGEPISPLLPLDGNFGSAQLKAWFGELLPGERRKRTVETLTKLSLSRIAEFLAWYGEDLPGDLSVAPVSDPAPLKDITRLVSTIVEFGESIDRAAVKLSLAGGEPKIAIIPGDDGKFYALTP